MLGEILQYTLPALIVLVATYLLVAKFLNNEEHKRNFEIKRANQKVSFPTRLRAYERLILFLERTTPENLLPRVLTSDFTVVDFQTRLIKTIREEYEHNLAQQIYVSDEAWDLIVNVKENLIKLINVATANTDPNDRAIGLSKKIFEMHSAVSTSPSDEAIAIIKKELKSIL